MWDFRKPILWVQHRTLYEGSAVYISVEVRKRQNLSKDVVLLNASYFQWDTASVMQVCRVGRRQFAARIRRRNSVARTPLDATTAARFHRRWHGWWHGLDLNQRTQSKCEGLSVGTLPNLQYKHFIWETRKLGRASKLYSCKCIGPPLAYRQSCVNLGIVRVPSLILPLVVLHVFTVNKG